MGKTCCGASKAYEFNGKKRMINAREASTIEKFSNGASARIKASNLKEEYLRAIA